MAKAIVLVHGGAGDIPDSRIPLKLQGVKESVLQGIKSLLKDHNGRQAICEAVTFMEDDSAFNAGYGSMLNEDGEVEMDAALMDGENLALGGIAAVTRVKNPICLAKKVLEHSPHCLLASEGALRFGQSHGIEIVPPQTLVSPDSKKAWEHFKASDQQPLSTNEAFRLPTNETGHDTVGAVVRDFKGCLLAGTSTGGLNGKAKGRIGDSPIAGAGLYADNQLAAVSTTGQGEALYKGLVAWQVASQLQACPDGQENEAVKKCMDKMSERVGGDGGAIAIDCRGRVAIGHNSRRMAWAYAIIEDGHAAAGGPIKMHSGCNAGEHFIELLTLD